jgi:hypothetical protein
MKGPENHDKRGKRGRTAMLTQLFYSGSSVGVLHEEYAKKGRIDEKAPITTTCEVRIEAPVERVWELLSNSAPALPGSGGCEASSEEVGGRVRVGRKL